MSQEQENQSVKIARLEEKLDSLKESVDKMAATLENLRTAFVPRSEFEQLSVIVKGIANDGGLIKRVESLELTRSQQKGSWSTVQVIATVISSLVIAFLTYLGIKKF